jgi:hypothetical protein
MTPVTLRALCGCVLSADEFFKIDKTALSEVLSEEATSVNVTQSIESKQEPKEEEEEVEENDDLEGLDEEMKKLLKEVGNGEDEAEEEPKGEAQRDNTEAVLNELLPYTHDLVYVIAEAEVTKRPVT